jgi:mycothiol synthase
MGRDSFAVASAYAPTQMTSARPLTIERVERLDSATAAEVSTLVERSHVHERHSAVGEHKLVRLLAGDAEAFALLARAEDSLVGYAQASCYAARRRLPPRVAAELVVDPAQRGRGIGRALLARLVDEARRLGVERLDAWAHHPDPAATGLAASYGMRPTRHLWQMAMLLDRMAERHRRPAAVAGVRLRTYVADDAEALATVVRDAFPEHPENADFGTADIEALARLDWFDPSTILLAEDEAAGELLAVHWMKLEPDSDAGEVYLLAVSPRAQGRGLGRAMLLAGLEQMRQRAVRLAYLYVDAENEAAIELYREAGFRHEHLDTCYSLSVA